MRVDTRVEEVGMKYMMERQVDSDQPLYVTEQSVSMGSILWKWGRNMGKEGNCNTGGDHTWPLGDCCHHQVQPHGTASWTFSPLGLHHCQAQLHGYAFTASQHLHSPFPCILPSHSYPLLNAMSLQSLEREYITMTQWWHEGPQGPHLAPLKEECLQCQADTVQNTRKKVEQYCCG